MKKNHPIYTAFFILGVFTLVLFVSSCGKTTETADPKIADQLIETINKAPMGFKITAEPANKKVETGENGRYLVTLTNPSATFDTSVYKHLNLGTKFKEMKIPMQMKELTFLYGPEEKYLGVTSVKGMLFDFDMAKMIEMPETDTAMPEGFNMRLKFSAENVSLKNFNISPLLESEGKDFLEIAALYLEANQSMDSVIDNITYEISFPTKEKKNISVIMKAGQIKGRQEVSPDFVMPLFWKEKPIPDFAKALEKGKALFSVDAAISNVNVSVKEDEKELGGGSFNNVSLLYYLKPDESKEFFAYGSKWNLENMKLNIPANKNIELLGDIKELGMFFSFEHLTPTFARAYFELIKESMAVPPAGDAAQVQQQKAQMGMKIGMEMVKSQPVIKFAISPCKHYFGELSAEGRFQVLNLMSQAGKAVVKISKVADILAKLKAEELISAEIVESISQMIAKFVVTDENGDGTVTFEMKQDAPGQFFLNGKPMGK
jgi:hypothetical protein